LSVISEAPGPFTIGASPHLMEIADIPITHGGDSIQDALEGDQKGDARSSHQSGRTQAPASLSHKPTGEHHENRYRGQE
jgi:hypothetical protein